MQLGGDVAVDGGEVVAAIAHEHDEVCRVEGNIGLACHGRGKTIIQRGTDAAGINHICLVMGDAHRGGEAVACDTGLVVHDGNAARYHAVENGRLAHIGSAYNGDGGGGHGKGKIRD